MRQQLEQSLQKIKHIESSIEKGGDREEASLTHQLKSHQNQIQALEHQNLLLKERNDVLEKSYNQIKDFKKEDQTKILKESEELAK